MQIINANLKFKGNEGFHNLNNINLIVLHHAEAKQCSAYDIHRWHQERGWSGAGYHYLVRKDGTVYSMRPENYIGCHAKGSNTNSLGVCFEGSFMTEKMAEVQYNAGKELIAYLKNKHSKITKVKLHKEVGSTDCPGTNFPVELKNVEGENIIVNSKPEIKEESKLLEKCKGNVLNYGEKGTYVYLAQSAMKALGLYSGVIDGSYGPAKGNGSFYQAVVNLNAKLGFKNDSNLGPACWEYILTK